MLSGLQFQLFVAVDVGSRLLEVKRMQSVPRDCSLDCKEAYAVLNANGAAAQQAPIHVVSKTHPMDSRECLSGGCTLATSSHPISFTIWADIPKSSG